MNKLAVARILGSGALALGCAAAEDGAPKLVFDTVPLCEASGPSCINAGTETLDVEGVRVIHKRIQGHPLVAMHVTFDAEDRGSRQLWAEDLGFAMLGLGGPSRFIPSDWDAELLRLGSTLSAGGGVDYGFVNAVAPVPNWREMWSLLTEGISDAHNTSYQLENRRGVFQRGFMSERDDPDRAASVDAFSRLFRGDVFNLRREGQDALAAVSVGDVWGAWDQLLAKRRLLVSVVGDVGAEELRDVVRQGLGPLPVDPAGAGFPLEAPRPMSVQADVAVLSYPDSPTWHIVSNFRGPPGGSADYAALELGLAVLDQRLFDEVRDARGLAYSTGSSLAFYRQSYGRFWLTSEAPLEALPVARQIVAELKASGPDEGELTAARSSIRTRLIADNINPAGLAWTLADWELTVGDRNALDEYLLALEQVTPDVIASTLDAYLRDVKTAAAGGGSQLTEADLNTLFISP